MKEASTKLEEFVVLMSALGYRSTLVHLSVAWVATYFLV